MAPGWSHTQCLPHRELAWAQPWCHRLGAFLQRDPRPSPLPRLPKQSPKGTSPGKCTAGAEGTQPVSPKGRYGPFLVCPLVPAASAWPVPQGCAVCHGLCHALQLCCAGGSPLVHRLLPVPVGPGRWAGGHGPGGLRCWPAQPRWAPRLFLEEGGRCLSPPPAACQARGGTCPHRALTKVRQRPGTSRWWPSGRTAVPRA